MFCDFFLSRVVGHTAWKDGYTKSKVSELASITDEAFAYLLVENYYEVWTKKHIRTRKSSLMKEQGRKRRGNLPGASTLGMHLVQGDMVGGQMKAY